MSTIDENVTLLQSQLADLVRTAHTIVRQLGVEATFHTGSHRPRVACIQRTVIHAYEVHPDCMGSRIRNRTYVEPRQVAIYLSRELTRYSLEEIGRCFRSDMDHGTVIHACAAVANRISTDAAFCARVAGIRADCERHLENLTMPLFQAVAG